MCWSTGAQDRRPRLRSHRGGGHCGCYSRGVEVSSPRPTVAARLFQHRLVYSLASVPGLARWRRRLAAGAATAAPPVACYCRLAAVVGGPGQCGRHCGRRLLGQCAAPFLPAQWRPRHPLFTSEHPAYGWCLLAGRGSYAAAGASPGSAAAGNNGGVLATPVTSLHSRDLKRRTC